MDKFISKEHNYSALTAHPWLVPPLEGVPLYPYNTFHSQGLVDLVLTICTLDELKFFLLNSGQIPWVILGRGSNSIFTDKGINGVLIKLHGVFKELSYSPESATISCGGAVLSSALARMARQHNFGQAEFLKTIPGTIAGAVYMNAGAHGSELCNIVSRVEFMDLTGAIHLLTADQCGFSYRKSIFHKTKCVITRAEFKLNMADYDVLARETELSALRAKTQPIKSSTWGSVFINPPNMSAAKLIDSCGLKGKGFGNARISLIHANFIENLGNAKFDDVISTINLAKQEVYAKFNIKLELEVEIFDAKCQKIDINELF